MMPQRSPRGHQNLLGSKQGIWDYQIFKNWDLKNANSDRYIFGVCKFSVFTNFVF